MNDTLITIERLMSLCDDNINLAAWACGVQERQMRNYLKSGVLPPQRAALAELRTKEGYFIRKLKEDSNLDG